MNNSDKNGFKEIEKIFIMPTRDGEELHFTVVEVGGEKRYDIRYFTEGKDKKEMFAGKRGVLITEDKFTEFMSGIGKLAAVAT